MRHLFIFTVYFLRKTFSMKLPFKTKPITSRRDLNSDLLGRRSAKRIPSRHASFGLNGVVNVGVEQRRKLFEIGKRQIFQINAALNAIVNELARNFMRLTERQIFLDEVIGEVGGVAEIFFNGAAHVVFANFHAVDNLREDRQRKFHGVERVESIPVRRDFFSAASSKSLYNARRPIR